MTFYYIVISKLFIDYNQDTPLNQKY